MRISQKLNEKKDIGCGIAEHEVESRLGSAHMSMDKESNFSNFATIPIKMNNSPVFTKQIKVDSPPKSRITNIRQKIYKNTLKL